MMKKVLYGVFMAFFAVLTMGSLQSCTDDLDGIKNEMADNFQKLDGVVADLKAIVDQNKKDADAKIADLQAQITSNDNDIDKLNSDLKALAGEVANRVTYAELEKDLADLEAALKAYADAGDEAVLAAAKAELQSAIDVVNARIDQLDADYQAKFANVQTELDGIRDELSTVAADVEKNKQDIADIWVELDNKQKALDAIKAELDELAGIVKTNTDKIADLTALVVDLQQKYSALDDTLNQLYAEVFGEGGLRDQLGQIYNALEAEIQELDSKITDIWEAVYTLEDKYDALTMRMDAMISSIVLQGVDSPVFGNLSLPLGIQTNMLFNWYFENLGESFTFPNAGAEYAYDGTATIANAEDIAFIKGIRNDSYEVPEGITETSLGKLYMTINPIGKDLLSGKTFYLETSKGVESRLPYTIDVQPSEDELMFNYTRGLENGFYESEVVIPADQDALNATKVHIDENLQESLKAVLKDQNKRTALNLIQAVWEQLNNSFKSYGVRAEWANPDLASREIYSVLSKYDLGVATAKPISFKFLRGYGLDKKMRTFGHFENLFYWLKDNKKLTINFDDIADISDLEVEVTPMTKDDVNQIVIEVSIPTSSLTGTATATSTDEIRQAIADAINAAMDEASTSIENYMAQIIDRVEQQLNDKVNGKIDSILEGLGDQTDRWFERLNKLIDLYNEVANKVNHFLENPNEYLQPAVYYKADGKMGLLSTDKKDPTIFVHGGGQSFELFLTTYTCELAAPCYKKIFACTNVVNPDGTYASNGREIAAAINRSAQPLANVISGAAHRIFVPTKAMKAAPGQYYEFLYQAVDYSGITSTKKFYIKVK